MDTDKTVRQKSLELSMHSDRPQPKDHYMRVGLE